MNNINYDRDGHWFVNSRCKNMGIKINCTRGYWRKNCDMWLATDFGLILRKALLTNGYGNELITARLGDDDRVTKSWPEVSTGFQGGTDLRRSTISVDLILDDKIFLAWRKLPNNNFK